MIIGRGLVGNSLRIIDAESYLFYANGISNSVLQEIPRHNFELNEIKELVKKNQDKLFVYFSTSQVNSKLNYDRAYVKHKLLAEDLVRSNFEKYLVVRTSNLVGHNPWNSHTLFNYLCNALKSEERITINPDVIRNFLDAEHFALLLQTYLNNYGSNRTIEIVNPVSFTMDEIRRQFEKYFSKEFVFEKVESLNNFAVFELNTGLSVELLAQCDICTDDYIACLLKKYYRQDSPETMKHVH